jgi:signal transduction histidine kinase
MDDETLPHDGLSRPVLHELANNVAGLAGLIELMQLDAEPDSPLGRQLGLASDAAERLRSLVRGLQAAALEERA